MTFDTSSFDTHKQCFIFARASHITMMAKPISSQRCLAISLALAVLHNVGPAWSFSPTTAVNRKGLVVTTATSRPKTKTALNNEEYRPINAADDSGWSYGEKSRPLRRDVFGYDDWVNHRSTDRFIGNLLAILQSGVFRELLPTCFFTSAVAAFVCLYNALLVSGYDDYAGVHHATLVNFQLPAMKFPADFFSLCTPSLALLLSTSLFRLPFYSTVPPAHHYLFFASYYIYSFQNKHSLQALGRSA
jgi:hypothetical protein